MSHSLPLPPGDAAPRMTARAWGALLILCTVIFLEGLDVSMMGVALPSMQADLGMSTGALQWVISAYVLGYGGFTLLGGRAADLLGRRRMFLLWLLIFLLFSGLGGFATEGWMLILSRFVTGVAAGFLTPAGLSIITTTFPEGQTRNQALLIYSGTAAAGFALGLVVGGLLTEIDWRWVFFAPVLIATVALAAAIRFLPDPGPPDEAVRGFDLGGAVTITAAMLLFVATVVKAPEVALARTIGSFAFTAALLAAFVAIERRVQAPLVRLGILRSAALVRTMLGAMFFVGAFSGFQFIVVLYLQDVRGWSSLETGLALLVAGIDALIAPTIVPKLVARFGVTRVILSGALTGALGYALFLPVGLDSPYLSAMFPTMLLTGFAFAMVYGPVTIAATDGVDPSEQGLVSGLLNSAIQFGTATGLAVMTAVSVSVTGSDRSPRGLLDGYHAALIVPVVAALLAAAITVFGMGVSRRAPSVGDAGFEGTD